MVLAEAQTNTGAKLFNDETLRVRNAAADAYAALKYAGTANKEITLPGFTATLEREPAVKAEAYAATVNLDFNLAERWRTISLTGALELTTSNRAAGRWAVVRIIGDTSARAVSTAEGWIVLGDPLPAEVPANKNLVLFLRAFGTGASNVVCEWILEGSANSYEAQAISAAGSTDIKPDPQNRFHSVVFTVTDPAYAGAYIHDVVLKLENANAGDRCALYFDNPASVDPTIHVHNDTTGGTELLSFTSLEAGHDLWAVFVYTGTAWRYLKHGWATDAVVSNEFLVGAETYAATVNLDLDKPSRQTLSLTGDVTLNTTNRPAAAGAGKSIAVELTASGGNRVVTVNANWKWLTAEPGTISSGESGLLVLEAWGTAETDVRAAWKALI